MKSAYISQGEQAVGSDADMVVSTILGSCISLCLWDPEARVGGMNHLLLPDLIKGDSELSAGAVDMDLLINKMVPLGAVRSRLRAKLFGGSSMLGGKTDIGPRNAAFGRAYLKNEGIPCDAEDVGGALARRLNFWPATGIARVKLIKEPAPEPLALKPRAQNGIEFF